MPKTSGSSIAWPEAPDFPNPSCTVYLIDFKLYNGSIAPKKHTSLTSSCMGLCRYTQSPWRDRSQTEIEGLKLFVLGKRSGTSELWWHLWREKTRVHSKMQKQTYHLLHVCLFDIIFTNHGAESTVTDRTLNYAINVFPLRTCITWGPL